MLGPSLPIELPGLRRAGGAMLALGVTLPLVPHHPGLPCPLRTMTGVPCPLCGMSTAVERGLAGHLSASISANPFGLVAIAVALALLLGPRLAGGTRREARVPMALVVAGLSVSWVWELRRFGFV